MLIGRACLAFKCLIFGFPFLLVGCNLTANLEDVSIPSVAMEVGSKIKGGEDFPIQLQVSGNNYSKAKIYYTLDGSTWSLLTELPRGVYNYTWSVPAGDYPQAGLRAVLENESGSSLQVENNLEIDSTPPAIPGITDHTSALTRNTMALFTIADCSDVRFVKITESATVPAFDRSWVTCSTATEALAAAMDTDKVYPFHLWFADEVGNINPTVTTYNKTRDRTGPALALTSFLSSLNINGGSTQNISWTYTDAHPHANPVALSYSLDDGVSWVSIANNQNTSPYSWTTGALNSNQLRIRIVAQDILGNSSEVISPVSHLIDSLDPLISLTLSSPNTDTLKGGDVLTLSWLATDANLGTDPVTAVYRVDGGSWITLNGTANHPSTGSLNWSVPANINSSNVEFAVSALDIVGRSKTTISLPYTIDNGAPALTWTSPADGSNGINGLTLSGACGAASGDMATLTITGDVTGSPSATCSAGNWSANVTFSAGFGNKTITVSQSDDAGNVTTLTRTFTRNQLAAKTYDFSFIDPAYRRDLDSINFNFNSLALDSEVASWELLFVNDSDSSTSVQSFTSATPNYIYNFSGGSQRQAKMRVRITDVQGNVSTVTSPAFQILTEVTTVIGTSPTIGVTDGIGTAARFWGPNSLTKVGNTLYVADRAYLRAVDISAPALPTVTTLVGSSYTTAYQGIGRNVSLGLSSSVTTDGTYVYASDYSRHCILRYNPSPLSKEVEVFLGACGTLGTPAANADQTKAGSRFRNPTDLKYHNGYLYISDTSNYCVRRFDMNDTVSTVAGYCGSSGNIAGDLGTNRINNVGIDIDSQENLWIAQHTNGVLSYTSLTPPFNLKTFSGTSAVRDTNSVGPAPNTMFRAAYSVRALNAGPRNSLFVTDEYSHIIVEIPYDPTNPLAYVGSSAVVAGQAGVAGSKMGLPAVSMLYSPTFTLIDGNDMFVTSPFANQIMKLNLTTYELSEYLGAPPALTEHKVGNHAKISTPRFLTTDGTHIYVAANNAVKKIDLTAKTLSTVSGHSAFGGHVDGNGGNARHTNVWGLERVTGGIYSIDRASHVIRFTDNSGNTRTVAGDPMVPGYLEATNPGDVARFNGMTGLCSIGNSLYVVDNDNVRIRRLDVGDINNPVTNPATVFIAGSSSGYQDGSGAGAKFTEPLGIACIANGAHQGLYLNDTRAVRKITLAGDVTTLAGSLAATGNTDGIGTAARFDSLYGIKAVGNILYVAESAGRLRKIDLDNSAEVTSIINKDMAPTTPAKRRSLYALSAPLADVAIIGDNAYVTMQNQHSIARVSLISEEVEFIVGQGLVREIVRSDSDGSIERTPSAIRGTNQVKVGDDLYVVSFYDTAIYKVDKDGVVSLYAGKTGVPGYIDGPRLSARFFSSHFISHYNGALYVADYDIHIIRKIDMTTGQVTTVAGVAGESGTNDGPLATARMNQPYGLVHKDHYLFFVQRTTGLVRALDLNTEEIFTVMGVAGDNTVVDGDKTTGRMGWPYALTAVGDDLYVTDTDRGVLRKIDITDPRNASVTTVAGTDGLVGYADGVGAAARMHTSTGLTTDGKYVYFTERGTNSIRRYNPANNEVTTWLGNPLFIGHGDGPLNDVLFYKPIQPIFTPEGFYISDGDHYNVRWVK
nr:hypothetical protein CKG001_25380 [Bdellovibrio sp. CKG001]